jgi:hypothetical protein
MAIQFVGHGAAAADTLAMSAVVGPLTPQVGDLCVVYVDVASSASYPALPVDKTGWTSILTGNQGSFRSRIAYKILEAGDDTIGTWVGGTRIQCNLYRGVDPDDPIGNSAFNTATLTGIMRAPIVLFDDQTGKSWYCGFVGHSNSVLVFSRNFTDLTNRSSAHSVTGIGAWDSAAGIDTWDVEQTANAGASGSVLNYGLEIKSQLGEPPAPTAYVWTVTAGALPTGLNLNSATGEITGTPSVAGLFEFTISVANNYLTTVDFECSMYIAPGAFEMEEALPEATYSMDVGELAGKQDVKWHRMVRVVKRPVVVEAGTLIYVDENNVVQRIDKTSSLADGAYWESMSLNQQDRAAEHTLLKVIVDYESAVESTLLIEASGDGGFTWEAGYDYEGSIKHTKGGVKRLIQGFNVSGTDLRFRVTPPSDGLVYLRAWQVHIIPRQQLESDR